MPWTADPDRTSDHRLTIHAAAKLIGRSHETVRCWCTDVPGFATRASPSHEYRCSPMAVLLVALFVRGRRRVPAREIAAHLAVTRWSLEEGERLIAADPVMRQRFARIWRDRVVPFLEGRRRPPPMARPVEAVTSAGDAP